MEATYTYNHDSTFLFRGQRRKLVPVQRQKLEVMNRGMAVLWLFERFLGYLKNRHLLCNGTLYWIASKVGFGFSSFLPSLKVNDCVLGNRKDDFYQNVLQNILLKHVAMQNRQPAEDFQGARAYQT